MLKVMLKVNVEGYLHLLEHSELLAPIPSGVYVIIKSCVIKLHA